MSKKETAMLTNNAITLFCSAELFDREAGINGLDDELTVASEAAASFTEALSAEGAFLFLLHTLYILGFQMGMVAHRSGVAAALGISESEFKQACPALPFKLDGQRAQMLVKELNAASPEDLQGICKAFGYLPNTGEVQRIE